MKLDQPFCTGIGCFLKRGCSRWTLNLERWASARGQTADLTKVRIGQFANEDGTCDHFLQLDAADIPCSGHRWVTRRMGGHPADPEAHQKITLCTVCGAEQGEP